MSDEYSVRLSREINDGYEFTGSHSYVESGKPKLSEFTFQIKPISDEKAEIFVIEEIFEAEETNPNKNRIEENKHKQKIDLPEMEEQETQSNENEIQMDLTGEEHQHDKEEKWRQLQLEEACEDWLEDEWSP